ncbi:Speckle-type POZ protein, partial [Stegodyphus mimosarum]
MMEEQAENKFTFIWIIENFSMFHQPKTRFLCSPEFALNCLPHMKWHIRLFPKGDLDQSYTAVYLKRIDDIPELCNMHFTVQGLDCREKSVFGPKGCTRVFKGEFAWGYPTCCRRDFLFKSLINDVLIIKLTMNTVCESSDQEILPPLAYKNGLFADVVLRANGAEFKVHKAILWARWPKLVEKLDAEGTCEHVFDMGSDVLEAILKYVYTGKLDCIESDLLAELYAACEKYELLNLQCLPVVAQKARTHINVRKISFEWPIKNFSSLPIHTVLHCHLFSVNILKTCKWNLRLHVHEDALHGKMFDISLCKMYYPETKPIFVRSKVSFDGINFSENEHLFETEKSWKFADFSRMISPDPDDVLRLKFEFKFSDCNNFSEIMESSYAYVSSIICHSLNNDFRNLYKTGMLSDINIIIGSKTLPAHKCVLCGRSSVFSRMFETDMIESERNDVEISDIDPQVMDEFLLFIYTGNLENSSDETAEQLYVAADKYNVPALKKKCSCFLISNLSVGNVCRILQLASLHSDDDLYKSVFEFSFAHAEEIFSTDEWKNKAKENFYMKFLQDMVVQKKHATQ